LGAREEHHPPSPTSTSQLTMRGVREREGERCPALGSGWPQRQPRRAVAGRRGEPTAGPAATHARARAAGAASRLGGASWSRRGERRTAGAVRWGGPSNQPDATNSFVVCFLFGACRLATNEAGREGPRHVGQRLLAVRLATIPGPRIIISKNSVYMISESSFSCRIMR
jgi:hypothetical protein